jgi:hypothetical protein
MSHVDLAMEGLELSMQETLAFRKAFFQLLPKMHIPFKSAKVCELRNLAEGMLSELNQTEVLTSRVLEKFIAQLDSLPTNASNFETVVRDFSVMQIEK